MTQLVKTLFISLISISASVLAAGKGHMDITCPAPDISAIGNTQVCQGQSVRLTIDSYDPVSFNYQWLLDGIFTGITSEQILLTNPSQSGMYTTLAIDIFDVSCVSPPSNEIEVIIEASPVQPSIVPSSTLGCDGDIIRLTSSSAPLNGSYAWFKDGFAAPVPNTQSIELSNPSESGAYTVIVISENSCTSISSAPVALTIEPLPPTPVIGSSGSSICADGTQVTLTSDLAPDGGSYVWFKDGGLLPTETSQSLVLNTAGESGAYIVQVIDGNGAMCTSLNSLEESVEIFELPTPASVGADFQLCDATNATLNANTPTVGTGTWTTASASVTIDNPNDPNSTVSNLVPGLHEFTWQIDNGLCIGSPVIQEVEVFAPPSPAITEADKIICDVTSTSITATAITIGTGQWAILSGSGTITDPANSTTMLDNLVPNTTVTLAWTVTNGNCTPETDQLMVQVSTSPSAAELMMGDQQLCAASTASIAARPPAIGTGSWSLVSGTATIVNPSATTTDLTGLTPGVGVVMRWTVTNECNSNQIDLTIENEAAPDVADAGADQELCDAFGTTLVGSGSGGMWSVISGTAIFDDINSPTSQVSGLSVGENVLLYTIDAAICNDTSDEVIITVFEEPSPANLITENTTLCNGETRLAIAAEPPIAGSGGWTLISGGGNITNASSSTTEINGLMLGENILRWTISNGNCVSNSADLTVFIYQAPTIENTAFEICAGESVQLNAVGGGSYLWTPSETLNSTTSANPIARPTETTTYSVTIERDGCENEVLEVSVIVNPNPELEITRDTTIFIGQSVQLFARGADAYVWSPAASLDNAERASPIATPAETTNYTVIGNNEFNCSSEASVSVTVDVNFQVFVPDLFSPNGDNVNDLLFANAVGAEIREFRIYDRRGREMFSSSDPAVGWDGSFNGSDQSMDSYIYFVVAELPSGEQVTKRGSIQLIR